MQLGPGWESEKSWEKGVRAPEPRSSSDSVGWNGVSLTQRQLVNPRPRGALPLACLVSKLKALF